MSADRYRTLVGTTEVTHREMASKFIARAFPIPDENGFKEHLSLFEKEHPSARHSCYAWVLGEAGEQYRTNDAGEPSGTAGKPILRRIRSLELSHAAVIVVRYFGGTLLGKAGLVHAYGEAARMALAEAGIKEQLVMERAIIRCGYDRIDGVKADVVGNEGTIVESRFTDSCELVIDLPKGSTVRLRPKWSVLGIEVEPH
ncbi:MAG: YigZ family protein [Flavobacteriales bacterium]|nr:YigZ family protein [Flavobacteriales bacterium]